MNQKPVNRVKPDAQSTLRSIGEAHGMSWNASTMLMLCTEFIDRYPALAESFRVHVERSVADNDDNGTSGQDRDSYSDDQDRESYSVSNDVDDPGWFEVHVCRSGFGHRTVRIKADSADDAASKAVEDAGNHLYPESDATYTVEGLQRLDEDATCRTCGVDEDGHGDGFDGECPNCADRSEKYRLLSQTQTEPGLHGAVHALVEQLGGDFAGACLQYPRADWLRDIREGDTQLGYWEWILHSAESDSVNPATLTAAPPPRDLWRA